MFIISLSIIIQNLVVFQECTHNFNLVQTDYYHAAQFKHVMLLKSDEKLTNVQIK